MPTAQRLARGASARAGARRLDLPAGSGLALRRGRCGPVRFKHAKELLAGQCHVGLQPLNRGGLDQGERPPQHFGQQQFGNFLIAMILVQRGQRHFQQADRLQRTAGQLA